MNLSLAELRALLTRRPDLAADNTEALKSLSGAALSDDVRALNPDTAQAVTAPHDAADDLYALIKVHAPDIYPMFVREYPFANWRIDLAIPSKLLAVEVDGGQFKAGGGKHGTRRDYQKTNALTKAGWILLRYRAIDLKADPMYVIEELRDTISILTR